jgi:plasmid stabilization system protein ParE
MLKKGGQGAQGNSLRNLRVPKKYKIEITKTAEDDLDEIWNNIALDSINNANNFVNQIEKKIYSLELFPNRGPFIPENKIIGGEYRHLIHGKYRVVYKVLHNDVFVMRIIHGSRLLKKETIE